MKKTILGKKVRIVKSPRKDKQLMAVFRDKTKVHFGDPKMPEFPGTKRGDNYCARSFGIGKRDKTLKNPKSANTLSRIVLWNCKGKKSIR